MSEFIEPGRSKSRSYRLYTPEEDQRLEQLRIAGTSIRAISQILGRSRGSVQFRLRRLAELDELRAMLEEIG